MLIKKTTAQSVAIHAVVLYSLSGKSQAVFLLPVKKIVFAYMVAILEEGIAITTTAKDK
ncbi:MAG: hypothetical protein HFJ09_09175 [Lachnospiraceae bacterium]|nr:hypothetical protein [Lachnospiraceae bacterium]